MFQTTFLESRNFDLRHLGVSSVGLATFALSKCMKKPIVTLLLLLLIGKLLHPAHAQVFRGCGVTEIFGTHTEGLPGSATYEQWLQKAAAQEISKSIQDNNEIYYIPVVVHVVHFGEAEGTDRNLSVARVQSQIDILNNDFGKLPGTPGFNSHIAGADTRIRFCLAAVGPNGEATSGIVRVQGSKPSFDFTADNALIKSSLWDPNRYLNIWTCKIAGDNYIGYAQYPFLDSIPMPLPIPDVQPDGVVIDYRVFGDVPAGQSGPFPAYNKGRTATHEIGHYLGLIHIWGDGFSCADGASDFCDDTPPQGTYTSGCPSSVNSCQTGVPAMFQNYMDYTNDVCMNIYTNDQKRRMRIVMRNAPRRKTLFTTPTQCGVSSVSRSLNAIDFELFPVPASQELWVNDNPTSPGVYWEITDVLGRKAEINTTKIGDKNLFLLEALPQGNYLLTKIFADGSRAQSWFVVQR